MKNVFIYLPLIFLLSSCQNNKASKIIESTGLYPPASVVNLDTCIGYKLNTVSGDLIRPLINNFGDTVLSGKPIVAIGKNIDPGTVLLPREIPSTDPYQTQLAKQTEKIPEPLSRISIDFNQLRAVKTEDKNHNLVLKNSVGDTVPTGVELNFNGKIVPSKNPVSTLALPPKQKDRNMLNIKYVDVEQGLNSSYILAILEDRHHNIWFGTKDGGVSIYNGITYNVFTEKEGLCNNTIRALFEDKNGNIWLGTDGGVCMYDGKSFIHFTEAEGLSNNQVLFIYEDSKNNLWFGTNGGGVCKYNGKTFINYTTGEGLTNNIVRYIMEDSQGRVWFGTNGGGITILHNNTFISFTEEDGLPNNSVLPIVEDSRGNFWFGTWGSGVCKYDGKYLTTYTEKEGLVYNSINSIVEDESGKILFGTWEGVSIYDGKTFMNLTEEQGLSYKDINVILKDHSGNFWMGTWGGGVSIYADNLFASYTVDQGLYDNHIFSMLEDSHKNIWFGSWKGVSKLQNDVFKHYTEKQGLGNNYVYAVYEDSKQNIWFGTGEGGVTKFDGDTYVHYTAKEGLCEDYINSVCEDNDGNIWFASQNEGISMLSNGKFTHFTEKEGLSSNSVNCIFKDHNGNLWFGTNDGGVTRFNGKTLMHFTEKEGLSDNSVLTIFEDSRNNLWFGTDGGGLCMFNGKHFVCYTTQEGLSDNSVRSIIEDGNNNIWASTQKGINLILVSSNTNYGSSVNRAEKTRIQEPVEFDYIHPKIHSYNELDGIKGIDFYKNSVLLDSDNRIWWGGGKSLSILDLNNFRLNENAPSVQLNRLEINEEFIEKSGNRSENVDVFQSERSYELLSVHQNKPLPYFKNHLTFYFSAIDWSAPYKIRYSYKLEGLNENWSKPSQEFKADYRNLPAGNYTFILRAIGDAQKWSQPIEYRFTISHPWWNTIFARFVFGLCSVLLVVALIKWRTRKLNLHKNQLQEIIKERDLQIEKANESDRLKSAFLANMSHEIRTPMNGILGFADLLKEPGLSGEVQQNYINIIEKSGARMLNIINDIISISKIESGQVEVYIQETDIMDQMQYIYTFFKPEIEAKGIRFLFQNKPKMEKLIVRTDREKVYSILTNLVKNAVKYTSHGTIEMGYDVKDKFLQIYIRDSGSGIPKDRQEAIFERFVQADISDRMALQGAGLGLSISKAYVEILGGRIWLESLEGTGSTFYFTLPYQIESKPNIRN
ncbi:two-component regulator propeller domain-containing protein [uncultured Draconibacterium sp.]|uniref:ligand-binding sensor domain-containing protein n=1 Tax=uncultured Draconibacterium sp. TaxID=1573823 RepID=UPI0032176812